MRFGVCYNVDYHPEIHKTPSYYLGQILEQVDLLEELGYDSVWFSEHHCASYSFGNPAVIAASAAARTKRIRIGTGVSLLPLHSPLLLAEQYGLLDVLSNGRLEYGVGRGYLMQEYDWFNVPVAESHARYREAMDFILKAWASKGEPMSFHGEFTNVDDYTYFPEPVQRPHPPIYASASATEDSYRWAGANGFNLGTALFLPDREMIRRNLALYRKTLVEHGYDPKTRELCAITQMYCDDDHEEAVREGVLYASNYYKFFAALDKRAKVSTVPDFYAAPDCKAMNDAGMVFFGNPANLVARMGAVRDDLDIGLLLMEIAQGRAPAHKVMKVIEKFGREVMPKLRAQQRAAA